VGLALALAEAVALADGLGCRNPNADWLTFVEPE